VQVKIEHLDCIVMHTSKHLTELTQNISESVLHHHYRLLACTGQLTARRMQERASLLAEADLKFIPLIKLREDQLRRWAAPCVLLTAWSVRACGM
jgi:hypothetical protein